MHLILKKIDPEHTFHVSLDIKDDTHPNFKRGADLGYVIDGIQGKALELKSGKRYRFMVNATDYPFYISTSEKCGNGINHSSGSSSDTSHGPQREEDNHVGRLNVSGTPTDDSVFIFEPSLEMPQPLYYGCNNGDFMGSSIVILT